MRRWLCSGTRTAAGEAAAPAKAEGPFIQRIFGFVAGIMTPLLPGMYGINLRFMKPMYAAVAAAGLSGLWCGLTGVKGYTMGGSPSFMSLITFIGGDASQSFGVMHGVVFGAIGGVVSLVVAAVLAYILYNDKDAGVGVAPSVPVAEEAEPKR